MKSAEMISIVILALVLFAIPAFSQEQTDTDKRITELEKKIEELTKQAEAPKVESTSHAERGRSLEPVALTTFNDEGKLVISSADGRFKYSLDGRVNLDAATYRGSENRLPAGFEVRRARIGGKATLFGDWLAEIEVDLADNTVEIKDLWAGFTGFKNGIIRVGNHKAPFGLDTLTSSKYITFIERGYIDSWAPDRRLGVSYSHWGQDWQFSTGVFGEAAGAYDDKDSLTGGGAGTSQEPSFVGRVSWAPLNDRSRVLHVGLGAARMKPEVGRIATSGADLPDRLNASRVVRFASRAETHVSRAQFLTTGDMKYVDSYDLTGLELAGVFGPVSFHGEYQAAKIERIDTAVAEYRDHDFSGYYGQVSWFVTGESRPYSSSDGEFGRVMPSHRRGALELALRYSTLDLNDITAVDPIKGGSAANITAGATWYINANHAILFNVTAVNNDEYAKPGEDWAPLPGGSGTSATPVTGDDFTIIAMRYQIAF